MSRKRSLVGREQETTPFNTVLLGLCDATPALAAALVDFQGETVDFAGSLDPFDIKVAAAEWRIVLDTILGAKVPSWPDTHEFVVRGSRHSYVVVPLGDGYAIVAQLLRHAFGISTRAITEAARELSREAGLEPSERGLQLRWSRVEVRTSLHDDRRPEAIWRDGGWCPLVVLGRYKQDELPSREVGYRVRLRAGNDITLVREPLGVWYADDQLDGAEQPPTASRPPGTR